MLLRRSILRLHLLLALLLLLLPLLSSCGWSYRAPSAGPGAGESTPVIDTPSPRGSTLPAPTAPSLPDSTKTVSPNSSQPDSGAGSGPNGSKSDALAGTTHSGQVPASDTKPAPAPSSPTTAPGGAPASGQNPSLPTRPKETSRGTHRPALPPQVVLGYYTTDWQGDRDSYDSLEAHADQINFVSPFWFSILRDGSIRLRGYDHDQLQTLARQKGVKILALVTNPGHHDAMLKDPEIRAASIDNLLQTLKKYHLDGVNIDFEGAPAENRAALVEYMKALYEKLSPEGYYVTIAVVASASYSPTDEWAGIFDYAGLAPYIDFMVLMTYDQHEESSAAGPVAAMNWVEARVKYVLSQVPAQKVVLGLAGYGYDWSEKGVQTVFARKARTLAASYGVKIQRDDKSGEANFSYTDADGVFHQVWHEDSVAVAQKLSLVDKYGLRGIALWRLGQEEDAFWEVLAKR